MNRNEIFSIFIPTLNRVDLLSRTLDSIIFQIKKDSIKIVISDNGSTDNTNEVIEKYRKNYKYIDYYKLQETIHLDLNHAKVLEYIDTKYCLMLGDDDELLEGAYDTIISAIENENYSFIALSIETKNIQTRNLEFDNRPLTFGLLWEKLPYSTIILNVDLARNIDKNKYFDTYHLYSGIAWETFAYNPFNVLQINKPTLKLGVVPKTWKKQTVDIIYRAAPQWFKSLPDLYLPEREKGLQKCYKIYYKLGTLMRLKSENLFDYKKQIELNQILTYRIKLLIVRILPVKVWDIIRSLK